MAFFAIVRAPRAWRPCQEWARRQARSACRPRRTEARLPDLRESRFLPDNGCEDRKPSRNEHGMRSIGAHRPHQLTAARRQGDFAGDDAADRGAVEPLRRATRSRRAGSKAISPRMARSVIAATIGLLANFISEFIKTFLANHGRIHVGEQELLAPPLRLLHDDIDRGMIEAARTRSAMAFASTAGPGSKKMSAAIFCASHRGGSCLLKASLARRSIAPVKTAVPDRKQAWQHASWQPVSWSVSMCAAPFRFAWR